MALTFRTQTETIKRTVLGLYMQSVCKRKCWSNQHAAEKVVEYLGSKGVSLFDFMEQQPSTSP